MDDAPGPCPELFAELPPELANDYRPQRPWDLLGAPLDRCLAALPHEGLQQVRAPDVHLIGDRIVIGAGTRLAPGVVIEGPAYLGRDVTVRPGAYLRGGVWIGDGCLVGANTEVKRAILLPGAKAPHLNYVGDSILGRGVNLGAGTILSNFRHDGGEILLPHGDGSVATGRSKLGAVLGDGTVTGCNCVLHPGCVVGRETQLYPGVQLRSGFYPDRSIVKLRQELQVVDRR